MVESTNVKLGIDNLRGMDFEPLRNKRVGLLSHVAALSSDGYTTADMLHANVNLVALFGPEHGFMVAALAGEKTDSFEHPQWHIPVYSLYGSSRRPSTEMLDGIDCMVCDLQDLGIRCYTYLATMRNMMQACASAGIPMIVLDRPIPLPDCIDGPVREDSLDSFVAPAPIPFVYGMTPAEAARWMQRNLFPDAQVTTIPMSVASRGEISLDALACFERPSPGIRTLETAAIYPMTVFTEAIPSIDCGLGTEMAFRVFGAPWIDPESFCETLRHVEFPGLSFTPCSFVSAREYEGQTLPGIRITVTDREAFMPFTSGMELLAALFRAYGLDVSWNRESTRPEWFDKLYGAPELRRSLLEGRTFEYDNTAFAASREAALLYR